VLENEVAAGAAFLAAAATAAMVGKASILGLGGVCLRLLGQSFVLAFTGSFISILGS
jgi:hypothetical protein